MVETTRGKKIRRIVALEERVSQCKRCMHLLRCVKKPSLGKGDLEPVVMLVFEFNSAFTAVMENIIELHNLIKKEFEVDKVYHSYMVRCQPKACAVRNIAKGYTDNNLLDKKNRCILTGKTCDGIPVRPTYEAIISCLPFLLEEIDILNPRYVILFGERTSEFVLKSYGIFADVAQGCCFKHNDMNLLTTVYEKDFETKECRKLRQAIENK